MGKYLAPSISEMGGLEKYLNKTKSSHNDLGYYHFELCLRPYIRISQRAMARLFNVNQRTIVKWVAVYKKEKEDEARNN